MKRLATGIMSPSIVRPLRLIAAIVPIVAMAGSGATRAEDPPVPGKAVLEFRVLATGSGHATWPIGSMLHRDASEGLASGPWHMELRFRPPSDGSECGGTIVNMGSSPPNLEGPDPPFLAWEVTGTVRRAETDKIELEYAWERRTRAGSEQEPRSGRDQVTLREDERVLLDFVPVPASESPASTCYHHVALELAASIPENPAQADRRIGYDLWLVSEDRGKRTTRQVKLIGKQGEKVTFDYGAIRAKVAGGVPSEVGNTPEVQTVVNGGVRGRVQADGSVELALLAERFVHTDDWAASARGQKLVRAAAGETLRLELPPPEEIKPTDPLTRQAIAQHQVSLVLTTTPLE